MNSEIRKGKGYREIPCSAESKTHFIKRLQVDSGSKGNSRDINNTMGIQNNNGSRNTTTTNTQDVNELSRQNHNNYINFVTEN